MLVNPNSPYGQNLAAERARILAIREARLGPDGSPRKCFKGSVAKIDARLKEIAVLMDGGNALDVAAVQG